MKFAVSKAWNRRRLKEFAGDVLVMLGCVVLAVALAWAVRRFG